MTLLVEEEEEEDEEDDMEQKQAYIEQAKLKNLERSIKLEKDVDTCFGFDVSIQSIITMAFCTGYLKSKHLLHYKH